MYVRVKGEGPKARVYVMESVRRGSKVVGVVREKLGHLEDLERDDPNALEKLRAKYRETKLAEATRQAKRRSELLTMSGMVENIPARVLRYGHYIVKSVLDDLGLKPKLDYLKRTKYPRCQFNVSAIAYFLIALRALAPSSNKHAYDIQGKFLGNPIGGTDLHQAYRVLDILGERKDEILSGVNNAVTKETNRNFRMVFFDVTNCYFEAPYNDEEYAEMRAAREGRTLTEEEREAARFRMQGPSKEHRFDLPLVSVAMVIDNEGIPVDFDIYSGNNSEYNTLPVAIEALREKYGIEETIIVVDRGLNSLANLKDANNRGFGFLVGQRVSNLPNEQKKAMVDPNGWTSVSHDLKFKAVPFKKKGYVNGVLEEVDCTLVLTFSEARKKRDLHELDAAIEYAQRCVNEQAEMPESRRYWTELVETSSKANCAVRLKQKVIDARRARCGYAGIVYRNPPSGKTELTPEEIVHAYHELVQIEDCFKIMKSNLNLRPMFLRTPLRIRGHILVCVLSLIVLRLLARRLRGMESPLPINRIIEGMEDAKVIAVHSGESEEWLYIRTGEESGLYRDSDKLTIEELAIRHRTSISDTAAVLAAAGLECPPVFCDRNQLARAIRTKFKSDADAVPSVVYRAAEMEREDAARQAS